MNHGTITLSSFFLLKKKKKRQQFGLCIYPNEQSRSQKTSFQNVMKSYQESDITENLTNNVGPWSASNPETSI